MRTYKENTTVVTASELRNKLDVITKAARKGRVIVERRHEPFLALLPIAEYEKIEELLDIFEDKVLETMAEEREHSIGKDKYLTHAAIKKQLGL